MADARDRFDEELDRLRTLRDEIEVQAHLGRAEVRELWEKVEHKWSQLEAEADARRKRAKEPLEQIGEAAALLVDEIKSGYKQLREII
jgi:hypothetical protein